MSEKKVEYMQMHDTPYLSFIILKSVKSVIH